MIKSVLCRWKSCKRMIVAALCCTATVAGATAEPARLPEGVVLGDWEVLEDPGGEATLTQVRARPGRFEPVAAGVPNYGFTTSAYWFRRPVENRRDRPVTLYLASDHGGIDKITLFVVAGETRAVVRSGDRVPPAARPDAAAPLALPFELTPDEPAVLYVRARVDAGVMLVPFEVLDRAALAETRLTRHLIHGVVAGVFGSLFLYNLFIFALLRERAYLYYAAYLLFAFLGISTTTGFGARALFPESTWFTNEGVLLFSGLSLFSILLFTRAFLRLEERPTLDLGLKALLATAIFQAVSPFVIPIQAAYQVGAFTNGITPVLSAAIGAVIWYGGRHEAKFFTLAHVIGCAGMLGFILIITGALPYVSLTFEIIPLSLSVAALLHAFALSHRIRLLQDGKLTAESAVRRSLETHKLELERVVAQRTAELEKAREYAERLATTDPLTGIYNRRGLFELAERQLRLAQRQGQPLAVLIFDIDRFKTINDTYGHAEGDRVLCEVVAAVRGAIREIDLFGRIGGDEFFLVLPGAGRDKAIEIAERIRKQIEANVRYGRPPETVTTSVGAAWLSERINNMDRLESAVDAALYRAKRNGRNRVEIEDGERRTA